MNKNALFGISILCSLFLGALAMWGYQAYTGHAEATNTGILNDSFTEPLFSRSDSPFKDIDQMRKEMDKTFGRQSEFPGFDGWFSERWFKDKWPNNNFGDQAFINIRTEEDARYLYYVLDIADKELTNFHIETADGYVSIKAELQTHSPTLSSSQRINQSFPVPAKVDPDSIKVEQLTNEIRVRFTRQP